MNQSAGLRTAAHPHLLRIRSKLITLNSVHDIDIAFEGFTDEAFETLGRLKLEPHIERYRDEKDNIRRYISEPFHRYRDDLVLNWVLPNHLELETERNVFSRILKNDFGAGGANHHLWLSFYRPGRRRLNDVQLAHGIYPDKFTVSIYVGGYARDLLSHARRRMVAREEEWLDLVNPLLETGAFSLHAEKGTGTRRQEYAAREPLAAVPGILSSADHIWLDRAFPRESVVAWKSGLIRETLGAVSMLWPIFLFWTE